MNFEPTPVDGAFVLGIERHEDERGFFARTWCGDEFARHGIEIAVVQASVSFNRRRGTLRGLHFAWPPAQEGKLVRCETGRVHDVILDLRPASPTYRRHFAAVLDAGEGNALFVPPGVAHGFQTLADDTRVVYMMSEAYRPELATGVRFDDPAFGIAWPLEVMSISARDRDSPDFDEAMHRRRFAVPAAA